MSSLYRITFYLQKLEINKMLTCCSIVLGSYTLRQHDPPQPLHLAPRDQPRLRPDPPRGGHRPRGQGGHPCSKDRSTFMSGLKRLLQIILLNNFSFPFTFCAKMHHNKFQNWNQQFVEKCRKMKIVTF